MADKPLHEDEEFQKFLEAKKKRTMDGQTGRGRNQTLTPCERLGHQWQKVGKTARECGRCGAVIDTGVNPSR